MSARYSTCSVEGCHGKHVAKGLCWKHYARLRRNGNISDPEYINKGKQCSVEGCENDAKREGMCVKHHTRFKKYGDVHTLKDPKEYTKRLSYNKEQCIMPDCKEKIKAKELCYKHYYNYLFHKRNGNVDSIFNYIRLRKDNPIEDKKQGGQIVKPTIVNKDAEITQGILKGTKGRVVAFDSLEDEVIIQLDDIKFVTISSDYLSQEEGD